tara:strand:+ start:1188 stop:1802 length:615 start_codon:yes stop_codon:yes gene_type:complete
MDTVESLLIKRKQIRLFDNENIPDKMLVKNLINKTYKLVASKQSLMPYKVTILGPDRIDERTELKKLSDKNTGGYSNDNIFAPYVICFTHRLVLEPNPSVLNKISRGHVYECTEPKSYKDCRDSVIEVGMFSTTLTALCMEHDIDVAYLLCFKNDKENQLYFLDDKLIFSMQLGYRSKESVDEKYIKEPDEYKPEVNEIINWLE